MIKSITIRCKGSRYIPFGKLKTFQGNLKEMLTVNADKLKASILKHGWVSPVFVWNKNEILDGHGRLLVLGELLKDGYTIGDLPVVDIEAKTKKEAAEILLAINSKYQTITDEGLYRFMHEMELGMEDLADIVLPDIDMEAFADNFFNEPDSDSTEDKEHGNLAARFGIPPFSVFNAREGWWQARKAAWIALGIRSEVGRGGAVMRNISSQGTPTHIGYKPFANFRIRGKEGMEKGKLYENKDKCQNAEAKKNMRKTNA